jgi:hypothetical protein
MYLIDYLDPTGEFKSLRNNCKTSKNSIGVEISFLCGQGDAEISNIDTGIQIAKVKEVSNLEFRKDLDEWLETAVEGEKKEWRVALGADEASWLRNEYLVSMADSIVGTVLPDKVIIIKSKDLAAIMQSQL